MKPLEENLKDLAKQYGKVAVMVEETTGFGSIFYSDTVAMDHTNFTSQIQDKLRAAGYTLLSAKSGSELTDFRLIH
jgi:hypothetical protein